MRLLRLPASELCVVVRAFFFFFFFFQKNASAVHSVYITLFVYIYHVVRFRILTCLVALRDQKKKKKQEILLYIFL